MLLCSVRLMKECVPALVQVYVMGRIPTALHGRTTEAPILLFTCAVKFTMIGLTDRGEERQRGRGTFAPCKLLYTV